AALKPIEVTKIQRQEVAAFREIVKDISEQKIDLAFDKLERAGLVIEINDDGQRHLSLAKEYLQAIDEGKTALAVSPTHVEGRQLTQVSREEMRIDGFLAKEGRIITRLESMNLTEAERGIAHNYQRGLVVQFHRQAGDFHRGERVVVQEEVEAGRMMVE